MMLKYVQYRYFTPISPLAFIQQTEMYIENCDKNDEIYSKSCPSPLNKHGHEKSL